RRKEGILDDLHNSNYSISEICYKYGFESLPHFSNFCKKFFGASPRNLRKNEYENKNKLSDTKEIEYSSGGLL
ncbi:helix-turn-helix domain-containing protein, partial [Bacteroides faecis]